MRKPDDCTLTPEQYAKIRKEAERALNEASAFGCFPTPIKRIMDVAEVQEVHEDVLNESFIAKLRREAGNSLKKAVKKVLGIFQATSGLVFIDQTLMAVKKTFIRLHEAAHGFLKWQREMYALVEDCEQSIDPDVANLFDREANVFASEVLFQLDSFTQEAEEMKFSIFTPVNLKKKYGSSIYSAVRQYVSKNRRTCMVLVLNPPEMIGGDGFRASLRRVVPSPSFMQMFGELNWPEYFTPDDEIGAMVPIGNRKASGKRNIVLIDRNGNEHECVAESFTQGYQVFILILSVKVLSSTSVLASSNLSS